MALLINLTRSNVSYQSKLLLKINKNNDMKGIQTHCLHTENNHLPLNFPLFDCNLPVVQATLIVAADFRVAPYY